MINQYINLLIKELQTQLLNLISIIKYQYFCKYNISFRFSQLIIPIF